MGRPKLDLDTMQFNGWDKLDALIVWGSEAYCAKELGISISTLESRIQEKHGMTFHEYRLKIREGAINIPILKKQLDVAMMGNVGMLIWLGKQYCGQSEKVTQDLKPQTIQLNYSIQDESNDK